MSYMSLVGVEALIIQKQVSHAFHQVGEVGDKKNVPL